VFVLVVDFVGELEALRHRSKLMTNDVVQCQAARFLGVLVEFFMFQPYSLNGLKF